jgi:CDP-diacylglycerol--serine O-phosphatidyltransferase
MKWRRIVPSCLTLTILYLGFQSILQSAAGNFVLAAQFIVLAGIIDGLDGEVARLFKGVTTFGAKLDTYVDSICFGLAPAVLAYHAVWYEMGSWGVAFTTAIVCSGVIRFACYQYKESRVGHHTFRGLPIPVCGLWIALIVLLTESSMLPGWFPIDKASLAVVMWVFATAFLVLQVSSVRYAKPTKEMIGGGLFGALVVMVLVREPLLGFCLSTAAALLLYAVALPIYVHGAMPEEDEEEPVKLRTR